MESSSATVCQADPWDNNGILHAVFSFDEQGDAIDECETPAYQFRRKPRNAFYQGVLRPMHMERFVSMVFLYIVFCAPHALGQGRTILYKWLNVPCSNNIHCSNGCSACNIPDNSDPSFFGTNMIWPGVTLCPHPVTPQDNALHTSDWPVFATAANYGLLSGMSTVPMQVDSIIIRHRSDLTGPLRLKISYRTAAAQPFEEIADIHVPTEWTETVLIEPGTMEIGPGMAYGTFQLKVQAYQGDGGEWQLDEIRIVASPAVQLVTGIADLDMRYEHVEGQYFDLLGRSMGKDPAPGFYIGQRRVVQVQ